MKKSIKFFIALLIMCMLFMSVPIGNVMAEERSLALNKEVYAEGEPIMVTATGDPTDYIVLYPVNYVPGTDAGIYYACFDECKSKDSYVVVEQNAATNVFDWECCTPTNPQVVPYIDIPEGDYKICIRDASGAVQCEVEFEVVFELDEPTPTADPDATPTPEKTKAPTPDTVITEEPDESGIPMSSTTISPDGNENNRSSFYLWIIAAAAVIVAVIVILLIVSAKKRKK